MLVIPGSLRDGFDGRHQLPTGQPPWRTFGISLCGSRLAEHVDSSGVLSPGVRHRNAPALCDLNDGLRGLVLDCLVAGQPPFTTLSIVGCTSWDGGLFCAHARAAPTPSQNIENASIRAAIVDKQNAAYRQVMAWADKIMGPELYPSEGSAYYAAVSSRRVNSRFETLAPGMFGHACGDLLESLSPPCRANCPQLPFGHRVGLAARPTRKYSFHRERCWPRSIPPH
jgi:hypothetical protein